MSVVYSHSLARIPTSQVLPVSFFPIMCGHIQLYLYEYYLRVSIDRLVNQLIGHPRVLCMEDSNL